MYVCICNAVTEKAIKRAAQNGIRDLWSLQSELGVAAGCGTCKEAAMSVLRENESDLVENGYAVPRLYEPSAA